MEHDFWHERWAKNETGFHLDRANPFLKKHWGTLQASSNDSIFVPLCGKSLDLTWLAQRVKHVIGIELSQKAVDNFFAGNDLKPDISQHENLIEYRYKNVTLYCGDFFQLTPADVNACQFIYDRACLIAFPQEMRRAYANKLLELFPQKTRTLLITLEYPQAEMDGPPFSVQTDEVENLFKLHNSIKCLETKDILEKSQRFKDKGITALLERVFILEKR
ncbi:MAG: thiopurine S-methyltransferase [Cycloclasticus sp. symbiont of Poecilosclerida sp. M]|nr:MAG: thiopurine S-methyltransferase [Cycloclasticus sp. symbiont of Poecilosclerida sp. M]